jgi:hypothetical protein
LNTRCLFWDFHRSGLGRVEAARNTPVAIDVDTLRREHAEAVARFRQPLPVLLPEHDWDADARFHGLFPAPADTEDSRLVRR